MPQMSILNVYEKIKAALEQGYQDGLRQGPKRQTFEFPNEQVAYEDGYKKGEKEAK
jgi:hypothetical protein